MSCTQFEKIQINKDALPEYPDHFWEVRSMLKMWNENMGTNFMMSWINCINESMSKWVNEFTCPGFMYVPRKPWPFGNEYHDAGCADSDIIWLWICERARTIPQILVTKSLMILGKQLGFCCDSQKLSGLQGKCLY